MKQSRRSRRFGMLTFFVPVVIVVVLMVVGVIGYVSSESGVLVVEAQVSIGSSAQFITVQATVSATTRNTPFNVTVSPGSYTVTYPALNWFHTPPPKVVPVEGGKTAYAIGVYTPVPVVITITQSGPNSTKVTVEHGVTPIVWVNHSAQTVQVESTLFSKAILPGGNFTSFFPDAGSASVKVLPANILVSFTIE